MCLFNRRKQQQQPQQRVVAIIHNALSYALDDNPVAPKRRGAGLAVVEETTETGTTWELRPIEPVAKGREAAFNESVAWFKRRVFNNEPLPTNIEELKKRLEIALWAMLQIL
jgi:hypothetical protein